MLLLLFVGAPGKGTVLVLDPTAALGSVMIATSSSMITLPNIIQKLLQCSNENVPERHDGVATFNRLVLVSRQAIARSRPSASSWTAPHSACPLALHLASLYRLVPHQPHASLSHYCCPLGVEAPSTAGHLASALPPMSRLVLQAKSTPISAMVVFQWTEFVLRTCVEINVRRRRRRSFCRLHKRICRLICPTHFDYRFLRKGTLKQHVHLRLFLQQLFELCECVCV